MLDLTNAVLFDCLMEGSLDREHIDLHNEYACIDIKYSYAEKQLDFLFRKLKDNNEVVLQFRQATLEVFNINFSISKDNSILDLFYRGRFWSDDELYDSSATKGHYFYINFHEDIAFEVFAKEVLLIKNNT